MKKTWARLKLALNRFHHDKRGIEGLEYLLLTALIIIAGAAAWNYFSVKLYGSVNTMANGINQTLDFVMTKSGMK